MVYLSTLAEVKSDPLGAIWITPADYKAVTNGTPFSHERKRNVFGYRRQSEREITVEKKIRKRCILADS